MSLPQRPLGDALQLASKKVRVSADEEYRIAGIYSFGRGLIKRPAITGAETSYPTLTRIETDQLAMSKLNAWEGALAIVTDEFSGAHVSPEYPVFDINRDVADPAYIKHLIAWPTLWGRLTPRGSMVRRKRTTPATLMATIVPLPDLEEQRRIATRLDTAQSKFTQLTTVRARADKLRQAVQHSLISGTDDSRPLACILTQATDYVNVTHNEIYKTAGIYSYGRGLFSRPPIPGDATKYRKYNRIREGQFVYSKLFGWEGALAVVPPEFDGLYMSHEFPTFEINEKLAHRQYVAHVARWPGLHAKLVDKATGMGSRRQPVSPARLLSATIPLPSLEEQQRIAATLDGIERTKALATTQEQHARSLRLSLLNAGFSGEL